MSDIAFRVTSSPEVVQQFNENKVNSLLKEYKLSDLKGELGGDGISRREAPGIEYDSFTKLSGGEGVITKASLIKFNDGKETPIEKIKKELERNLPPVFEIRGPNSKDAGDQIFVQARTGNTADQSFIAIGGNDKNRDGKLNINNELAQNSKVETNQDALDLGGDDDFATPDEAMNFFLKKAGVGTEEIVITSKQAPALKTKVGSLLDFK